MVRGGVTAALTCAHCAGPTSAGSMVSTLISCGCPDAHGRDRNHIAEAHPDTVYCSLACERGAEKARSGRPRCPWCHREHDGRQRPSYCSKACQKHREKALERAIGRLADRTIPGGIPAIDAALKDLTLLREAWAGRDDHGHRLPPIDRPPPVAVEAARRYGEALLERRNMLRRGEVARRARATAAREAELDRQRLAKRAARQQAQLDAYIAAGGHGDGQS